MHVPLFCSCYAEASDGYMPIVAIILKVTTVLADYRVHVYSILMSDYLLVRARLSCDQERSGEYSYRLI